MLTLRYVSLIVCCTFPVIMSGCGRQSNTVEEKPVTVETTVRSSALEEEIGTLSSTIDLRPYGIWASIRLPQQSTITSEQRDNVLIAISQQCQISITRIAISAEEFRDKQLSAKWKEVEKSESGWTLENTDPVPCRAFWTTTNPYPGGYLATLLPAKGILSAKNRERITEILQSFTSTKFQVDEITRSQQAVSDLRQAGISVVSRAAGFDIRFPWEPTTDKMISRLADLTRVSQIHFVGTSSISEQQFRQLASCRGVSSLVLEDVSISDGDWKGLQALTSLREIRIESPSFRPKVPASKTKFVLEQLKTIPSIRSVIFRRYDVDPVLLTIANQLSKKTLSRIGFNEANLTDEQLKILVTDAKWKGLALADNPITSAGLALLRDQSFLEQLDLTGCRVLSSAFNQLGQLPMKQLNLARTDFTDSGLSQLVTQFPNLLAIQLDATLITPATLKQLGNLKNLQEVSLAHLGFPAGTINPLAELKQLRVLNLANASFELPEIVKVTESLSHLEELNLSATGVDSTAVQAISKARPQCQLVLEQTPASESELPKAVSIPPVVLPPEEAKLPPPDVEAMLKKFDAFVTREPNMPEGKIVEISIASLDLQDSDLAHLRDCKTIESLRLDGCEKITDRGLFFLNSLSKLHVLSLNRTSVSADGLAIVAKLKQLTSLELPDVTVTKEQIAVLTGLENLETIRGLIVSQYPEAFVEFLTKFKKLKRFDWSAIEWNNHRLQKLRGLTALETLEIRGHWISDYGLEFASSLINLRELTIQSDLISDSGLKPFEKLSNLKILNLEGLRFGDGVLLPFRNHGQLENLRLACPRWTDRGSVPLRSFPKLIELDLFGSQIGDLTVQQLATLKDLEWIDLSQTKITDEVFKHLISLEELRKLSLTETDISGEGLKSLRNLPRLSRIELNRCGITNKGLEELAKISAVAELNLSKLSTKGLKINLLKTLPNLRVLHFDGNLELTDQDVESLLTFERLEELSLVSTKVSAKGLSSLRKKDGLTVVTD